MPPKPATVSGGIGLILSGCVFAAFALLAFGAEARSSGGQSAGSRGTGVVVLFVAIGIGMAAGGVRTIRRARKARLLAERYPDQPWMLRPDWASGRMRDRSGCGTLAVAAVAVISNLIVWVIFASYLRSGMFGEHKGSYIIVPFLLVGVGMAVVAIYRLLRWRKYGTPVFEMAKVPGVVGGSLGGVVLTRANLRATDGFKVRLRSIHRKVSGSGKNRKVQTETLWEREMHRVQPVSSYSGRSAIPVLLTIPYECRSTGAMGPNEDCYWELTITGETPGINYKAVFHVPVYRTKDSSATVGSTLEHLPEDEQAALGLDIRSVPGLRLSQTLSGGERMAFTRYGGHIAFSGLLALGLVFLGAAYLLWDSSMPRLFLWIFVGFGAFMLQVSLSALLRNVHVVLHRDRIEVVSHVLGIRMSPRIIAREQIERISVVQSVKTNNNSFYDLAIHTKQGKRVRMPVHIRGQTQAEIVSSYIQRKL